MYNKFYNNSTYFRYDKSSPGPYSNYKKKPTTFADQVSKLEERNMIIENKTTATQFLTKVSYYHLSPYWKPFCIKDSDNFENNTEFTRIIELYEFDKELREFLLKHIAPIEVAYKTNFVYFLCNATSDPFAYLDEANFSDLSKWQDSIDKIIKEFDKSQESYSSHHKQKYPGILPPLWVVSEFLTLGELNHLVINLDTNLKYSKQSVREEITSRFGLSFTQFTSFIMSLTLIRNFCAHNCRVWDRDLYNQPKLPTSQKTFLYKNMITNFSSGQKKGIYNTLVILAFCLKKIGSSSTFARELIALINHYKIDPEKMGFPKNWKKLPLWQ